MIDATPLLKLYAAWRGRQLDRQDPAAAQERQLLRLVRAAEPTRFGRDHGFDRIASVADFQERVPLRRYEDLWEDYWAADFPVIEDLTWPGRIPYLAATSGTTSGRTKHIPVSREMLRSNKGAVLDLMAHHLRNRPGSRVLGGKNFMLGSASELSPQAPGVLLGELTGISVNEIPFWAEPFNYPPKQLALLSDWDSKMERLARESPGQDIRTIGGTASWLLLFLERTVALSGRSDARLVDLYPNLELLVHGGVDFAPYRRQFERLLEGSHAELREVYPASEGFIAVADRGTGDGLRMILDRGLFFEFVPLEELESDRPTRHWIGNAEPGVDYALVLSSCAGVWAYVLGDTVRLLDSATPRLLITGRTSYYLSAFGEHLIAQEIEAAVAAAAEAVGCPVVDYSVAPLYPERPGEPGGHLYIVEFAPGSASPALDRFAETLDAELRRANRDYGDYRASGFGLAPPRIEQAPAGTFSAWMKARGKLGGQNKVPRIITDPELLQSLRRAVQEARPAA